MTKKKFKEPKYEVYHSFIFYEGLKTKLKKDWDILYLQTGERAGSVEFYNDARKTFVYMISPRFKHLPAIAHDLREFILKKTGHDLAKLQNNF